MKKIIFSFLFIAASAAYVVYLYFTGTEGALSQIPPATQNNTTATSAHPETAISPTAINPSENTAATTASAPSPAATSKSKGIYADGTYTGSQADAYYGTVQVQATIQNGRITDVSFLQHPGDRSTSQYINSYAMPILKSEALQAQSANVDVVSGATETSGAFQQSLGDALAQAKQ